jgi:hypothetical protein
MATADGAPAKAQRQALRWKWLLLALCGLGGLIVFATSADIFGLGGRPWLGYWDSNRVPTRQPYVVAFSDSRPHGASARAGIRDGDWVDLREQSLDARVSTIFSLMATRPTTLAIHRGATTFKARIVGSNVWEGEPLWKLPSPILATIAGTIADVWFLACALIIAIRRSLVLEGRILALVLLCDALVGPVSLFPAVPSAMISLLWVATEYVCGVGSLLLLVYLSSRLGVRHAWRYPVEWFAYATNVLYFGGFSLGVFGLITLRFDPVQYIFSSFWGYILNNICVAAVVATAAVAVASTPSSERPRAAWLLLPLPTALAAGFLIGNSYNPFISSLSVLVAMTAIGNVILLLGALAVTYALLKRRVLDFGFVLSRTIVVGIISLIVVAAFVLLEWLLGTVLAGVSHTAGLFANAGLALVLGVSLRYIHKRVDTFVDATLFRKRYDDERALRDFAKEAAFVTNGDALLDQAVGKLREHTDARAAALFVHENGIYKAIREFGEIPAQVGENDPAILALKMWHRPLDPHQYATGLHGDLALPMVSRGQLLGVLLCGKRAGGEAYAPDEVEALSEFAHGIGSAFDGLQYDASRANGERMLDAIHELRESNVALRESMERGFTELRGRIS